MQINKLYLYKINYLSPHNSLVSLTYVFQMSVLYITHFYFLQRDIILCYRYLFENYNYITIYWISINTERCDDMAQQWSECYLVEETWKILYTWLFGHTISIIYVTKMKIIFRSCIRIFIFLFSLWIYARKRSILIFNTFSYRS